MPPVIGRDLPDDESSPDAHDRRPLSGEINDALVGFTDRAEAEKSGVVESDPGRYPVQPDAGKYAPPPEKPKKARSRKAEPTEPVEDVAVFTVHPGGTKNPSHSVRAPSKLAAIHYAKTLDVPSTVKLDDGLTAKLGLNVVTVDKAGGYVGIDPRKTTGPKSRGKAAEVRP